MEVQEARGHRIVPEVALHAGYLPLSRRERGLEPELSYQLSELHPSVGIDQQIHVSHAGRPAVRGRMTFPLAVRHTLLLELAGEPLEKGFVLPSADATLDFHGVAMDRRNGASVQ
jgi:hypothetical protein